MHIYTELSVAYRVIPVAQREEACGFECALCSESQATTALFGSCAASTYASLRAPPTVAAYPGQIVSVRVEKLDRFGQVMLSDSLSRIEAYAALESDATGETTPDELLLDPSVRIIGEPELQMNAGHADLTIGVVPRYSEVLRSQHSTTLDRQPLIAFRGVDVVTGAQMWSGAVRVDLTANRNVCPQGYILALGDPDAEFSAPTG
eukprot:318637-Rhodomonas_salina.2